MNKIVFFTALLIIFSSCEKSEMIDDSIKFERIVFHIDESDKNTRYSSVMPAMVTNWTTEPVIVASNPFKGLNNSSCFQSDSLFDLMKLLQDSVFVNIPTLTDNREIEYSESMWPLSYRMILKPTPLTVSDTTIIPPFSKQVIKEFVEICELTIDFELFYIENSTGRQKTVKGIWEGEQVLGFAKEVEDLGLE